MQEAWRGEPCNAICSARQLCRRCTGCLRHLATGSSTSIFWSWAAERMSPVTIDASGLGPLIAHIRCSVAASDDHRHAGIGVVDRSAAFLPAGAAVYEVRGYSPDCRLAGYWAGGLHVYLAQRDVHGHSAPRPCALSPPPDTHNCRQPRRACGQRRTRASPGASLRLARPPPSSETDWESVVAIDAENRAWLRRVVAEVAWPGESTIRTPERLAGRGRTTPGRAGPRASQGVMASWA